MESMGRMGWGFGNSLGGVGSSFLVLLDSRWEIAPRLVFCRTFGVRYYPLREHFRNCLALLALGMLPWKIIFSSLIALLSGTLILLERLMIGSWNSLLCSSISCTPLVWDRIVYTSFIGPPPREGSLRLEYSAIY